ncbi:hypothetical protein CGGC5_v004533 [Colletotrichum fructicola Nara gc5]|uniref:Antifungal protein n=1 Tax=Colletotrichum fructicola (strain Nara gc5) TaxID=1213859 RepID=A0A7J6JGJ5_COLFN|nr:hypothetical protein CFRS1_v012263 [Colletotrichum fructicola]KAF4488833.1 hypothetical protein CGGC5_v004533 [Colletotrichum fructicola Nara gc5]KAF4881582.1 hypothetical protein CGCFRS4_v015419 [Colletotrichum fructicola]
MKFPTLIAATILLGLGANAAAVTDTDAAMAAGIGGNKHYGKCLKGPNQCVLNQKHGERRIDCRKPCSKDGARCREARVRHQAHCW